MANTADSHGVSTAHMYAPGRPAVLEVPDWFPEAWAILEARAELPGTFTVDDLCDDGMARPDRPSDLGALFRKAQRAGIIQQAGFVVSRRKERHKGPVRVWIGTEHTGEAAA
ncbi:hypothetical protein [Sinomonas sp. P10A9]|uniref:Helix-turn-helix protein n=1 Tax=Sinomonas puerhi TaxID=3238584 RepID=A0AB39L011_9MICC